MSKKPEEFKKPYISLALLGNHRLSFSIMAVSPPCGIKLPMIAKIIISTKIVTENLIEETKLKI